MDQTEDKLVHPDFIAKNAGIETEADYKDIVGPWSAAQGHEPTVVHRVTADC